MHFSFEVHDITRRNLSVGFARPRRPARRHCRHQPAFLPESSTSRFREGRAPSVRFCDAFISPLTPSKCPRFPPPARSKNSDGIYQVTARAALCVPKRPVRKSRSSRASLWSARSCVKASKHILNRRQLRLPTAKSRLMGPECAVGHCFTNEN